MFLCLLYVRSKWLIGELKHECSLFVQCQNEHCIKPFCWKSLKENEYFDLKLLWTQNYKMIWRWICIWNEERERTTNIVGSINKSTSSSHHRYLNIKPVVPPHYYCYALPLLSSAFSKLSWNCINDIDDARARARQRREIPLKFVTQQ